MTMKKASGVYSPEQSHWVLDEIRREREGRELPPPRHSKVYRPDIAKATRELSDEIVKTLRHYGMHGSHNEAQYTHRRIKITAVSSLDEQFRVRVNLMSVLMTNDVVVEAIRAGKVKIDVTNPNLSRSLGGRFENAVAYTWMCIRIYP